MNSDCFLAHFLESTVELFETTMLFLAMAQICLTGSCTFGSITTTTPTAAVCDVTKPLPISHQSAECITVAGRNSSPTEYSFYTTTTTTTPFPGI